MQESLSRASLASNLTSRSYITRKNNPTLRSKSKSKPSDASFQDYYENYLKQQENDTSATSANKSSAEKSITSHLINCVNPERLLAKQRRRSPTPVKSRKQISKPSSPSIRQHKEVVQQKEQEIIGLEIRLEKQKMEKDEALMESQHKSEQILTLQKQVEGLKEQVQSLQKQGAGYRYEIQAQLYKISSLEHAIHQSQNNLSITTSSLNKLKRTVRESRVQEIEQQHQSLQKQVYILKQQLQLHQQEKQKLLTELEACEITIDKLESKTNMVKQFKQGSLREQYLESEVARLRDELSMSRGPDNNILHTVLVQKDSAISCLSSRLEQVEAKLSIVQFSRSKEMKKVKQQHESQLKLVRARFSRTISEIKSKNMHSKSGCSQRPNRLAGSQSTRFDDHKLELQLSPDP